MVRAGIFGKFNFALALSAIAGMLLFATLVRPGEAGAASTTYPGGEATSFAGSPGGWQSAEEYEGLCIQGVTCPTVAGAYEGSDGSQGVGDGFLRTTSGSTLLSAVSTSTQTWRSPEFTYNGINGQIPAALNFDLKIRSSFQQLLALGADANYSVTALNQSGGPDRILVAERTVGTTNSWAATPQESVVPGNLSVGSGYVLEIRTTVGGLVGVLPAGSVDFDDVALTAADATGPGDGGPGGEGPSDGGPGGAGGTGGAGGNGGTGGTGTGAVLPPPTVIPAGAAYFYKNQLFIRVKCPKRFKPKCNVRAAALTKKKRGKAMTNQVGVSVKSNRFKRKALVVKPKFRTKIKKLAKVKRKTIIVRLNIKSKKGKKKGTAFHKLRVLERRK